MENACMDVTPASIQSSPVHGRRGEMRFSASENRTKFSSRTPRLGCLVNSDWSLIPFPSQKKGREKKKKHIMSSLAEERVAHLTSSGLTDTNAYKVLLNKLPAVGRNIPDNKDPAHHPGWVHSSTRLHSRMLLAQNPFAGWSTSLGYGKVSFLYAPSASFVNREG